LAQTAEPSDAVAVAGAKTVAPRSPAFADVMPVNTQRWRGRMSMRHALRALACHPDVRRAPREWISLLKPTLDAERKRLSHEDDRSHADRRQEWSLILDGAVLGLCHMARVSAEASPPSVVGPFAVLAVGDYGRQQCEVKAVPELLFLTASDRESRGRAEQMIAFILTGLGELGLAMHYVVQTPATCAGVIATLAHGQERLATMRHLWGRNDLRARLDQELQRLRFAAADTHLQG
jgi:UTP:GlnB (protein PII) uridylyltransferase